jgi:hypothetical protein
MLDRSKNWSQQVQRAFAQLVSKLITEIAELALHWAAFQLATSANFPQLAGAIGNPFGANAGGLGGLIGSLFNSGSQNTANAALLQAGTALNFSAEQLTAAAIALQSAAATSGASGGATSVLGLAGDSGVASSGGGILSMFGRAIGFIGSIFGFDSGTMGLEKDGPIFAHRGEIIIPPRESSAIRSALGSNASFGHIATAAASMSNFGNWRLPATPAFDMPDMRSLTGGDGGGDVHNHAYHFHVSATDARSFTRMLEDHSSDLAKAVRKAIRNGHPSTRL